MQALTFIFAFVAVLALILLVAWLVRRFAGNRLGTTANRGRMPRLAVIDAAAVDGRRRLVLVRRDNVEHLLMIGGPTDIVVESNIVRVASAREQIPQRPGLAAEPPSPPRIAPLPDAQPWPDNEAAKTDGLDHPEPAVPPMPELPTRPLRPAFGEDGRRPMPERREPRGEMPERREPRGDIPERREREPITGFTPEPLPGRPEPRQDMRAELRGEPRMEPRTEPRPERLMPRSEPMREPILPRALRPAEPPKQPDPFRPQAAEPPIKPPPMRAPERVAAPPPPPPPAPPAPPAAPPAQSAEANLAEMAQRLEAALRRPPAEQPPAATPPSEPPPLRQAARAEPPAPPQGPAPGPKTSFENLEDEMASLLGRPKSSS
jgi:flagellar biogenesis protein FliO